MKYAGRARLNLEKKYQSEQFGRKDRISYSDLTNREKDPSTVKSILDLSVDDAELCSLIDFSKFTELEYLKLPSNYNCPLDLSKLKKLEFLDLGYAFNQPLDLEPLENLSELKTSVKFNQPIKFPKNLKKLNCNSSYLVAPVDMTALENLEVLCWVAPQPPNTAYLKNLKNLYVSSVFNYPLDLSDLDELKEVSIRNYGYKNIVKMPNNVRSISANIEIKDYILNIPDGCNVEYWHLL
jgi:hypothetical protein